VPRRGSRTQPGVSTPGTSHPRRRALTRQMNVRSRKNTRSAGLEVLKGRHRTRFIPPISLLKPRRCLFVDVRAAPPFTARRDLGPFPGLKPRTESYRPFEGARGVGMNRCIRFRSGSILRCECPLEFHIRLWGEWREDKSSLEVWNVLLPRQRGFSALQFGHLENMGAGRILGFSCGPEDLPRRG